MKNKSHWILALAAALVVAGPALASAAANRIPVETLPANWEAVAASGQVEARFAAESDSWQTVRRGDALQPQTLVQTGKKGRATLTRSASLMILDPQSQVELPGAQIVGPMETSVIQTEGSVLYKVDSRANPHFEVVTPYLVAGVKGTSFLVTVNERYASITVEHGLVEVTNPVSGEVEEVGAGESVLRYEDQREMEMFHDMRASRVVRKESRLLDRMVRRHLDSKSSSKTDDGAHAHTDTVADGGSDSAALGQDDLQPVHLPSSDTAPFLGTDDPILQLPNDDPDISTDLTEEMIREGIRDGSLEPVDGVVPLPDPGDPGPGDPVTPGLPGDPINPGDPVDPEFGPK